MQISTTDLPDTSVAITYAFNVAMALVSPLNACASPLIYMLMVYNLGGDNLINFAPDSGLTPPPSPTNPNPVPSTYFSAARKQFNINSQVVGLLTAASDQGTSVSDTIPQALQGLTLANLQNLKTPWGRTYLGFQQDSGNIWGLS